MLIRVWLAPVVIFEWMLEGCVVISCLLAREQKEAYFMLYLLGITLPVSNQFFCSTVHKTSIGEMAWDSGRYTVGRKLPPNDKTDRG